MKIHWSKFILLGFCLGVIFLFSSSGEAAPPTNELNQLDSAQFSVGQLFAVLNEVMPKPSVDGYAWVELYVDQQLQRLYLPVVARAASGSQSAQVSEQPAAAEALPTLNVAGWKVTNELGQAYTLPAALSAVPKGTFILISFDGAGAGADDYDPSDGVIHLHTPVGVTDIFPDAAGQAALYRSGGLDPAHMADFVAWGGFSDAAGANAVEAGLWGSGQAASFENGLGDTSDSDILEPNESLGRYPRSSGFGLQVWANYPASHITPGAPNPIQPSTFVTPEDGARVETSTLSLSWRAAAGAARYRIQIDNDASFAAPEFDVFVTTTYFKPSPSLPSGIHYWRINPEYAGFPAGWIGPFTVEAVGTTAFSEADVEKVLGIAKIRQNKDSYLLGLDGAPEGNSATNTPENAWDSPAPCVNPPCADYTKFTHGNMYCVRASTRMVASWYNTSPEDVLSMDRLSYHILEEWTGNTNPGSNDSNPDNDLGYNRGMWYPDEENEIFAWALNLGSYSTPGGKPSFADVKTWIDADRPIMFRRPGHMMVIDGYRQTATGDQFLHVLDPDQPPDLERWQDYDTQTIDGYWVGPASGTSRHDEDSVSTDSDGDGIMDFDEARRFFTGVYDTDSDNDWVLDKQDMREYVFDAAGNYNHRGSDWDGDGLRKELDPDNDNDGSPEGCEDTNYNGIFEAGLGETDNLNASSHQACVPVFDILYPLKIVPENAGDHASPDKILVQVSTAVPAGWALSLAPGDFNVQVGASSGDVLSLYTASDTTFLVVNPPSQSSANYYDLRVDLSGAGSDQEADAVFYLPKIPKDEVIVLDRSGSMLAEDKIGAAKNAASAFVDFLSDGDYVGATSFATSASIDYGLHEILPGSTVREDSIAAIDGLTATGSTALGQGVQAGYGLLTGSADPSHDWSLVLLSDGWENVPPYWDDIASTVTEAVIHTVALGEDADTALLQSIAGARHGNYFFVDVTAPVVSLGSLPEGGPPLDIPDTLPNRLADAYLSVGELTHNIQRLATLQGSALEPSTAILSVEVPKGLPEAIFAVNWNDAAGDLALTLEDPGGTVVKPDAEYRSDTHHQLRVLNPKAGTWKVTVRISKPCQEYLFTLSGRSITTLIAAVGGNPAERVVGTPVPIYGVLSDFKPIAGADVFALVAGTGVVPGEESINGSLIMRLYDDGAHGDGRAGDGWYADTLYGVSAPGSYMVKVVASGLNNSGETFLRYANTGFNVLRRAAYIWKTDLDARLAFENLISRAGMLVDSVHMADVAKTSFFPYDVIVIGPDTGYLSSWGTPDAVSAVVNSQRGVLGLGEGGYAFFGQLKLQIGYPQGAHGSGTAISWLNSSDQIWNQPYVIPLLKEPLVLYRTINPRVDIYVGDQPTGVEVFGLNDVSSTYANLLMENRIYMLWGFNGNPDIMTETGKKLFTNTLYRLIYR